MFSHDTRRGLAPRSWAGVAIWAVLIAVTIAHPVETIGLAFNAVRGAGQWVGYSTFASCGTEPPHEWMDPKPCPYSTEPIVDQPEASDVPAAVEPSAAVPDQDDGAGVYRVDGDAIRSVLDTGTDVVLGLHQKVTEAQASGGLTVELGNPREESGS